MADTSLVKLLFTAKPGLYPPHKGGQTWLHEKARVAQVPHEQGKEGFTTKVLPTVLLRNGDIIEVDPDTAETLTSRYQCFSVVPSGSEAPASRRSRSRTIAEETDV